MNKQEIYEKLIKDIPTSKIYIDEPMNKHTSFKIGGNADIYFKANSIEDIKYILKYTKNENISLNIIGNGSNLLVKDNGIRGITMQIDINEINIIKQNENIIVKVGAGVKLGMLAMHLAKKGISGIEFASGIPGTIGGAIRMNAGAYGKEFKDIIEEVTVITREGIIKKLKKEELDLSYRHSRFCNTDEIIISATLNLKKGNAEEIKQSINELLKERKEKQPTNLPSAGSTFKRGKEFITAKLIDEAGLKGFQIGGAQISTKHAGFVVNTGKATAKDVLDLIEYVTKTVYEKFNKKLEIEIEIIGE